ncbi:LysR family transcriptional regulator [Thalassomonas sp. RHCl1]|uniref:LysR family transcriptional regulator n=1 Tax=Thalassomonas sp. RHCl1 TaxID=2995320 RepID=UPI00248CF0B1|nr:LysR family transcriptional regulator [Thalassomonas sp. RHCl1]
MKKVNYQEFYVFSEIVRSGTITAAAQKLGMAKSAVSLQLNRLEQRLQVKLLERSARRLALTREGEQLLPQVESFLAEGLRLVEQAAGQKSTPSGMVRISATPDMGTLVMKQLLPVLRANYPDIHLVARLSIEREDLQDPAFDLAIRIGKNHDENLVVEPLGSFKRILVASPDFAEKYQLREVKQLQSCPCLGHSAASHEQSWTLFNGNKQQTITVNAHFSTLHFSTLMELAQQGLGICNMPDCLAREGVEKGLLVQVLPQWACAPVDVYLAYRFGSHKIHRVKAVIDTIKKEIPGIFHQAP